MIQEEIKGREIEVVELMRNASTENNINDEEYAHYLLTELAAIAHYTATNGGESNIELVFGFNGYNVTINTICEKIEDESLQDQS